MNTGAIEPTSSGAGAADRIRLPTKVLVDAPFIPLHFSGLAMLLSRLFERIEPSNYCLVTFHSEMPRSALEQTRGLPALPATTHWLPRRWRSFGHARHGYPQQAIRHLRLFGQEVVIAAACSLTSRARSGAAPSSSPRHRNCGTCRPPWSPLGS